MVSDQAGPQHGVDNLRMEIKRTRKKRKGKNHVGSEAIPTSIKDKESPRA